MKIKFKEYEIKGHVLFIIDENNKRYIHIMDICELMDRYMPKCTQYLYDCENDILYNIEEELLEPDCNFEIINKAIKHYYNVIDSINIKK